MTYRSHSNFSTTLCEPCERLAGKIKEAFPIKRTGLFRFEIEVDQVDLLTWLSAQHASQKVYWCDRDGQLEAAGVGVADALQSDVAGEFGQYVSRVEANVLAGDAGARYYGGLRFSQTSSIGPDWKPFGAFRFVLPRFELLQSQGRTLLACNIVSDLQGQADESVLSAELQRLVFQRSALPERAATYCADTREDSPDQEGWKDKVNSALRTFADGQAEKIVLARKSEFAFQTHLDCWEILRCLRQTSTNCHLFGVQPVAESAFIGATPERLYRREGRAIVSEALAGTRPRGDVDDVNVDQTDCQLEQDLLHSDKDLREHRIVANSLRQTLEPLCNELHMDSHVSVRKLARVQHLACGFHGELKPGISDLDLLEALHPTPAVGGSPGAQAQKEIARLEPFDRGWYAGPVGWIGQDEAEFAVAIRSGLIHRDHLCLYSGAGIVKGSTPEGEWDEIEDKIANFVKVITAP